MARDPLDAFRKSQYPPRAVKRTYTLAEAATLVGRTERSVWSWVAEGKVHAEKAGKSWAVDADSLLAFARA